MHICQESLAQDPTGRGSTSASRNLVIISKRDPENSPEFSEFLYLCGNHWAQPWRIQPTCVMYVTRVAGPKKPAAVQRRKAKEPETALPKNERLFSR